ncbi:pyridoxal-phosphate dependent enzyme [Chloroflexota bacterium]
MIKAITRLPRVHLGYYPTPLAEAKHLSSILGGPKILIKRDDLSGLALGGNKCRKLEFLLGYTLQQGYDSFIISGISNLSVQLAAACARKNIPVTQILLGSSTQKQGNTVLTKVLTPEIKIVAASPVTNMKEAIMRRNEVLDRELIRQHKEGHNPFVMRSYDSTPMENTGLVNAFDEIHRQLTERNIRANYLIIATSQGGSHAGLEVGNRYLGSPFKVLGISTLWQSERAKIDVARMATETAEYLNLDFNMNQNEIMITDEYLGSGYGRITKESTEAMKIVARTEGIFLDPIYTGKAMAGLIGMIRQGYFNPQDVVVFFHTGGIPIIFEHCDEFDG